MLARRPIASVVLLAAAVLGTAPLEAFAKPSKN
jgi:hypothetical protein